MCVYIYIYKCVNIVYLLVNCCAVSSFLLCDNMTQLPFNSVALTLVLLDHMPWLQGHISAAAAAAGERGSLSQCDDVSALCFTLMI